MAIDLDLDDPCGQNLAFRDLIECGTTWKELSSGGAKVENIPIEPETLEALRQLCEDVLDPVIDEFGPIDLTYGLATTRLLKKIKRGIAPKLDQHASYEKGPRGELICERRGAAVDFRVLGISSWTVACWIVKKTPFDRVYYYGVDRPIHVSTSERPCGQIVWMTKGPSGKLIPRRMTRERFLAEVKEAPKGGD